MSASSSYPVRSRAHPPPLWADSHVDLLPEAAATSLARVLQLSEQCKLTMALRFERPWLSGYPRIVHLRDTAGDQLPGSGILGLKTSPIGGQPSAFEYLKQAVVDNALSRTGMRHIWAWSTSEVGELLLFITWLRDVHNAVVPPNVWLGTRIQSTSDLNRLPLLLQAGAPATKRFIILEPTREQVDVKPFLGGINWVIAGLSSQAGACLFDVATARRLRDACGRARTPLFITAISSSVCPYKTHGGKNWYLWPSDLRIRAFPDPTFLLPGRNPQAMARKIKSLRNGSLDCAEARAWPYLFPSTRSTGLQIQIDGCPTAIAR